jgi:hypothetical protein
MFVIVFVQCFVRLVLCPIRFSPLTENENSTELPAEAGEESMKLRKTKIHWMRYAASDFHRRVFHPSPLFLTFLIMRTLVACELGPVALFALKFAQ